MIVTILLVACAGPPASWVDALGDTLPPGAALRLGSTRWQIPSPGYRAKIALSPDGKVVLACGLYGLKLLRRSDGLELPGPPDAALVRDFLFLPGGKRLAYTCELRDKDGLSTGARFRECAWPGLAPSRPVDVLLPRPDNDVQFRLCPDGRRALAIKRCWGPIRLVSRDGKFVPVPGKMADAWHAEFSPDGKTFALCLFDGSITAHDAATGRLVRTLRAADPGRKQDWDWHPAPVWAPDSSALYARVGNRHYACFDLRTGKQTGEARGSALHAAASPDGKRFAVIGREELCLHDAKTLRLLKKVRLAHQPIPFGLAYSPDGEELLVASGTGVRVIDEAGRDLAGGPGHREFVSLLAFSNDGRWLASGGADGAVVVWDVKTGRARHVFTGHAGGVTCLAWSHDGATLAAGAGSTAYTGPAIIREGANMARVWDVKSGKLVRAIKAHDCAVASVAFFDQSRKLITCDLEERTTRWWAVKTGRQLGEIKGGAGRLGGDGNVAWSNAQWRLGPGMKQPEPIAWLPKDGFHIYSCNLLPLPGNREAVVIGSNDKAALLDVATGVRSRRFVPNPARPRWMAAITADLLVQAWHADLEPGVVYLRECPTGRLVARLQSGQCGLPCSACFSPDGRWLATAARNTRSILLWDVDTPLRRAVLAEWAGPREGARLAQDANAAAAFLGARLRLVKRARAVVAQLDDDSFEVRQTASRRLAAMGMPGQAAMAEALSNAPSVEARARILHLISGLPIEERDRAASTRRLDGALRVLRRLDVPAARRALAEFAAEKKP